MPYIHIQPADRSFMSLVMSTERLPLMLFLLLPALLLVPVQEALSEGGASGASLRPAAGVTPSGPSSNDPEAGAGTDENDTWLERGLQAEAKGDFERALQIWSDARRQLEEPDARIGLEYIRLATEQGLQEYYAEATGMYLWAISRPFTGSNEEVIRTEIQRLQPL